MNSLQPRPELCIGIDPGRHTGVAVWDCENACFLTMQEMTLWEAKEFISAISEMRDILVVIEDPNLTSTTFRLPHLKTEAAKMKHAQDVGRVKEHAALLIQYCEKNGLPFRQVKPMAQKKNAADFQRLTGEKRRINQHVRDAAMLVYHLHTRHTFKTTHK